MSEVIKGGAQAQTEATSEAPKFTAGPWSVYNVTDDSARDWYGHVSPAIERLRAALRKAEGAE